MKSQLISNTQNTILSEDLSKNILQQLKNFLIQLYEERLDKTILFGSRARGDNHSDSDFDILIILKNDFNYSQEIEKTSEFISQLSLRYDIVISRNFSNSFDYLHSNIPSITKTRK
jgi:predicted nucleotidyltransferase